MDYSLNDMDEFEVQFGDASRKLLALIDGQAEFTWRFEGVGVLDGHGSPAILVEVDGAQRWNPEKGEYETIHAKYPFLIQNLPNGKIRFMPVRRKGDRRG